MKTLKKVLCLVLSMVMAFSCMSVAASAENVNQLTYSLKYYSEKSDAYNADITLDKLDEVLADADIHETIEITKNISFEIDLRSVNALCDTLDEFEDLLSNLAIKVAINLALGDLDQLDFDTWKTGMQRGAQDETIVKELLEFLAANKTIISSVCDASLDLGLANSFINIKELLGEDGISGLLTEVIIGIVYEEGSAEFEAAYNTYKNDIDAFIYGDLLNMYTEEYLPGFTMDASSKVEDLICLAAGAVLDEYLVKLVSEVEIDLATSSVADLQALAPYVNLKGSTYDLSDITLDDDKGLLEQLNTFIGKVANQIVPGYSWIEGDWTKINDNLEGALRYLGEKSGLIENIDKLSFEEIALEVINIVMRNVDAGVYEEGIADAKTLEEAVTRVLANTATEMDMGITYKGDEDYLIILGDMLAFFMYNNFNVTDNEGKPVRPGNGMDAFEVLNYTLNYYLFEKDFAGVLGLETTKTETWFLKADKIVDYFGETKSKGVNFDSKEFLLGTDSQKGLLDSILSLDLENIIKITAVPALETAGEVSAIEFIYKTVQYFLNNWSGKTLFPAYSNKAFTKAISNDNIANMASILLETLDARKNSVAPAIFFIIALALKGDDITMNVTEATVADFEATGVNAEPEATLKIGDTTLVQDVDFMVLTDAKELGEAVAEIVGIGLYEGSFTLPYNIVFAPVGKVTVAQSSSVIKLSWKETAYADSYNVYMLKNGNYELYKNIDTNVIRITDLKPGTKYKFKVEAVNGTTASAATEVSAVTEPEAVAASSVKKSATENSVTLSWTAAEGAAGYRVERYVGKKWVKVNTVTTNKITIKNLESYTKYTFRIRAYTRDFEGDALFADPSSSISVRTELGTSGLTVSTVSSGTLKLSWKAVEGATGYKIQQYSGGKWKNYKTTTATSYTIKKLNANTKYTYRVCAYVKTSSGTVYGTYTSDAAYTNLAKPKTIKVSKTTSSYVKVSWSKVAGAKGYQVYLYTGGKWVKKASTTKTEATIKGLKPGQKYYVRVRAYYKSGSTTRYGDYTSNVTVLTLPATVSGVKTTIKSYNLIMLGWSKASGAKGYQVYKYKGGKWVKIATTSSTSYTDKKLSRKTSYKYKVRAYYKSGSKTVYGEFSSVLTAKTR